MSWMKELGLPYNPFDVPVNGPDDVFESTDLERAQEAIIECVMQRQLLIIKAPAGGGKTTLVYDLLVSAANQAGKQLLLVRDFTLSYERLKIAHIIEALVHAILVATGSSETVRKGANARFYQLQRLLGQYATSHEVVLVLEDGHVLPPQCLINLKRLRELRLGMQERLLSIVVLAHPQIDTQLMETREVKLRCEVTELQGLTTEEVEQYLQFKISRAGAKVGDLLTPGAVKVIAGSVRWPQEINRLLTDLLKQAVQVGTVPITRDLAERACGGLSTLASLKMMSGITVPEIRSRLANEFKIKADRYVIRRVLAGHECQVAGLKEAIRKILLPLAAGASPLLDEVRTRLTRLQQERMEKIHLMLAEFDFDYDFVQLAEACRMRPGRVHQLLIVGQDPTDEELIVLDREVKKVYTQKRKVA